MHLLSTSRFLLLVLPVAVVALAPPTNPRSPQPVRIKVSTPQKTLFGALSLGVAASLALASPAWADGSTKDFKFPPIDRTDASRCSIRSSTIGQANAARDKLYDLRECKLEGVSAVGYDLSGVILTKTDLRKANLQEAYLSKGFLRDSNLEGADFSNAIVDRANFQGSSLKGALFKNTVLTGTSFEGADVEGVDFSEAALGSFDVRSLCKNPTLKGVNPQTGEDTRLSAGCP